ncbi:MAG TPA: PHP domain-containing protein, partial [Chitinophagaceae bacterium]|nr:PHP domain-containing protein [Chitinophagaceae bacterium]
MYLNCKTYFSFRYGTFGTEELVTAGAEAGATAMALTNINNTCDAWDFYTFCLEAQIKPVLGAEIRNGDALCYLLLARDCGGFMAINRFLSLHLQSGTPFPERPELPDQIWIVYPLGKHPPQALSAQELIGVMPSEVNRLYDQQAGRWPDKYVVRQPVTFQD